MDLKSKQEKESKTINLQFLQTCYFRRKKHREWAGICNGSVSIVSYIPVWSKGNSEFQIVMSTSKERKRFFLGKMLNSRIQRSVHPGDTHTQLCAGQESFGCLLLRDT